MKFLSSSPASALLAFSLAWFTSFSFAAVTPLSDGEAIAQLQARGVDMTISHEFEFVFRFPTQENAKRMLSTLDAKGFEAAIDADSKDDRWVVRGKKTMVPIEADLVYLRNDFKRFVRAQNGFYEGCAATGK
jgi:hypothetical protein